MSFKITHQTINTASNQTWRKPTATNRTSRILDQQWKRKKRIMRSQSIITVVFKSNPFERTKSFNIRVREACKGCTWKREGHWYTYFIAGVDVECGIVAGLRGSARLAAKRLRVRSWRTVVSQWWNSALLEPYPVPCSVLVKVIWLIFMSTWAYHRRITESFPSVVYHKRN